MAPRAFSDGQLGSRCPGAWGRVFESGHPEPADMAACTVVSRAMRDASVQGCAVIFCRELLLRPGLVPPPVSVNLLGGSPGRCAAAIVAAAKQHGNIKTLCGIEQGEAEVSFTAQGLKASDVVLLSFDLEANRALTSLDLWRNETGASGAETIAAALPQS